jgi:hypothetical protein
MDFGFQHPSWWNIKVGRYIVKPNFKALIFGAFAVIPGVVVLLGYFIKLPLLFELKELFLEWAVILTAVAIILGVINLLAVHWQKISTDASGWIYSVILIFSFVLTTLVVGFFGPASQWSLWIFNYIQIPIETSLLAVLAIILIVAVARMVSERRNIFYLIFILTIFLILLGTITIPFVDIPALKEMRVWVVRVWAIAGARGILLGVGLGTIATGIRILLGTDRPYSG